jgi:hypothetical protein
LLVNVDLKNYSLHEHSILFIERAIKNEKDKQNIYYINAGKLLGLLD